MGRSVRSSRFLYGALPGILYEALRVDLRFLYGALPGFPYEALRDSYSSSMKHSLWFLHEALPWFLRQELAQVWNAWGPTPLDSVDRHP